jgi:spoIIIJ-associated protein
MDAQHLQRGQQWLETLLPQLGLAAEVAVEPQPVGLDLGLWLTIQSRDFSPQQVNRFLAADAALLDALQYLLNVTLNMGHPREQQMAFTLDIADHRLHRYQALRSLADQAAATVRQTQSEFVMQPLSAAERRMVHTILQDDPDLETFSRGQDPDRRLVVRLRADESSSGPPAEG